MQRSGSTTTGAPGSAGWTGSAPTSRGRTPADEPGRQLRAGDRRPPEAVFAAFTGQDGQEAFNSEPGWIVESECDLRVGGVWTVTFGLSRDELHRHEHVRSEEHTSELQSHSDLVCRLLLEKKKNN